MSQKAFDLYGWNYAARLERASNHTVRNNLYSIKVIARGYRGAELLRFLTSHYLLPFQFAILFLIP